MAVEVECPRCGDRRNLLKVKQYRTCDNCGQVYAPDRCRT